MTARKDDTSPIKSIFCHKSAIQHHKKAIQYNKRPYKTCKAMHYHKRQYKVKKATHGREMRQEKDKELVCDFIFHFVPFVTYFA